MNVKRLCLGTVQFGMNYGINNKIGKPANEEIFYMLDYARERGIEILDTAASYGESERVIGEYIKKRKIKYDIKIVSKLKPNLFNSYSDLDLSLYVEKFVKESLTNLKIDILEGYLLHTPADIYVEGLINGLIKCKESKLIKNIGVSIYEMKHALDAVKMSVIDYIQLPYNLFDQRVDYTDLYNLATENNVKIFARSPFLQGLIVMNYENIPDNLNIAKEYIEELDLISEHYKMSKVEIAIMFVSNNLNNDFVVFGVDNIKQLKEYIDLFCSNKINLKIIDEIKRKFCNVNKSVIFPNLWNEK